jgi:hypothetical protein
MSEENMGEVEGIRAMVEFQRTIKKMLLLN